MQAQAKAARRGESARAPRPCSNPDCGRPIRWEPDLCWDCRVQQRADRRSVLAKVRGGKR